MTSQELIIEHIFLAQVASDAAKGIRILYANEKNERKKAALQKIVYKKPAKAYHIKDEQIEIAIDLICRSHSKNIRFSVAEAEDCYRNQCYIVYFDFKMNGKREQVSFHSFNWGLRKFVPKSRKSTWSKDCDSRETVANLEKYRISDR